MTLDRQMEILDFIDYDTALPHIKNAIDEMNVKRKSIKDFKVQERIIEPEVRFMRSTD
jgi:hypothetical protein